MSVRISHCSQSLENYYLCLKDQVAGFVNRGPQTGDLVYLAVKVGKKSLCGARFKLDTPTDHKPWADADNYVNALTIREVEYCTPFDLSILATVGGPYWPLKYVQGVKPIKDAAVTKVLDLAFSQGKQPHLAKIEDFGDLEGTTDPGTDTAEEASAGPSEQQEETIVEDEQEFEKALKEVPDAKISIMATFQTVQFSNETDKIRGLESLVNRNFYHLFSQFQEETTLLIPENRIFKTEGPRKDGSIVTGIRTIPDGLLIEFDAHGKHPFRINLIEYECYGQQKQRDSDKSVYLNSVIIPQLMRFASAFSIITDEQTRTKTVNVWVDKIIDYINSRDGLTKRCIGWVRQLNPTIQERAIDRELEKMLIEAFRTNLRVMLVIDELSTDQKNTIKNVVSSFKLASGDRNVQFAGYVVRLVQKISILNQAEEYALTIQ
ncbi:MAG: hypothetical protein U0176_14590 [Bacteroidia bacterium]